MNKSTIKKIIDAFEKERVADLETLLKDNKNSISELSNKKETSLLHEVCSEGHVELLLILCKYELDLNVKDRNGYTPAVVAAISGQTAILSALFSNGVDPLAMNDGLSLIHYAAISNNTDTISLLLNLGADVNLKTDDDDLWPPLFYAVQEEAIDAVDFLLSRGADIDYIDNEGFTALHNVAGQGSIDMVKMLIAHQVNINTLTDLGTALHNACAWNHIEIVRMLVDNGAKVNLKDDEGMLPIDVAKNNGNGEIVNFLVSKSEA